MTAASSAVTQALLESFASGQRSDQPYTHWFLDDCLPASTMEGVCTLPFAAPSLDGISGKREAHNATRVYFDAENRAQQDVIASISDAFQSKTITDAVQRTFQTTLAGTYLRIEYAQDIDGFWLEPHTDLGVKLFTMLLYLSDGPGHDVLGTDIYDKNKQHVGRSPFKVNGAMVFVPSDITYHGFEPRTIEGVRKSLIINYVSDEWRAREQLAFPDAPIAA